MTTIIAPSAVEKRNGIDFMYGLPGESEADYGRRVADELEAEIERLGPESVAACIAEPVVGATAGAVPPVPGYFKRIREICDAYGVLLIFDEVMCGMGRTGTLFACEQEGVVPDLVKVDTSRPVRRSDARGRNIQRG